MQWVLLGGKSMQWVLVRTVIPIFVHKMQFGLTVVNIHAFLQESFPVIHKVGNVVIFVSLT